ncbi:MAG: adenosylcobinamide-GDP ribazoletransferase [Pseudomonadota bacterium]
MSCTLPLALTFLTKFPWFRAAPAEAGALVRSMFWFPWVGALLGVVFWGVWAGLPRFLPDPAAAGVLLCLTVWLTGGLHLDGLADTVDGLGGGHTVEERLAIMKDSRVGTFGVLALALVLVLKFSFFLSLAGKGTAAALILYPVVSRWGMVLLAYLSPYARPEGGLGQAMTTGVSARVLAGATVSAAALSAAAFGVRGPILLAAAGLLVWLGSLYCRKTLGGVTGDVLGAANEALEVLVLGGALLVG